MRCKPGDLARIVHPSMDGHLVTVLHAAPAHDFRLPDGQMHDGTAPGTWVCESLGSPFPATVMWRGNLISRPARFAVIGDQWLRPIRDPGDDAVDQFARTRVTTLDASPPVLSKVPG